MRLARRLAKLEAQQVIHQPAIQRVLITTPQPLDLSKSSCTRRRGRGGHVFDYIVLHGKPEDMPNGGFERWVQSFPIVDS